MDQNLLLSSHILDTARGRAASNVKVLVGGDWIGSVFDGVTNTVGKIRDFPRVDESVNGVHKLRLEVAEYLQRLGHSTLFPFIEVN